MAASRDNLLSLGHLTGTERNTFTKQREQSLKKSVNRPMLLQADLLTPQSHHQLEVMHLQQRWQELKERERTAQQHNRLLLQQFDDAQDTLNEMITLTAAMKTIRKEYERYLEESSPHWQQQLEEKIQAAQRKRMDEYLRSCLKNTEDHVTKSSADRPSLSQGPSTMPKEIAVPPKHYSQNSHNQDGSPHLPFMQSSRQTFPQSQTARLHIRAPYQPQGSSHVPPSFLPPRIFPHPHSFQLNHHASTLGHHHPSPRQNPPGWASLQPDYHWSWAAGAAGIPSGSEPLWGQLYMEEPPSETVVAQAAGEEADTSRAPSSKRERSGGDRSSNASQELDIKPVRLSNGHAESSESSPVSREKRKKKQGRGRSQCSSSDRERCSSQKSSTTSSDIVIAAVTVAQSSESDDSSVKGRTSTSRMRRSGGLAAESPRAEKVAKGSKGVDSGSHKEESQSTSEELQSLIEESRSENVGNQSPDDKSENYREESESQREKQSGSISIRIENGGGAEMEEQKSSSSEHSSGREKDEEDLGDDGDAEEKEKNQTDVEKAERDVEDNDDASERKNRAEEEEETEDQDEESEKEGDSEENQSDRLKNEDGENTQQGSASSQDEEVDEDQSEEGEDNTEDGESDEEEEEQRRDKTEEAEERDSEDSIISPQDKSKKMHTVAEEASEDEDDDDEGGSKMGSSDDGSNDSSDDVEHLLAPQQSQKKKEKDLRADEKPKGTVSAVFTIKRRIAHLQKNKPSFFENVDLFHLFSSNL
ncbi:sarcoplasmic reticulum histidine-rich calcium-binding protein isoform X2 [Etheostoma spectabile]|uniref:sarcoplasmic reticulum histidine-rich calcium-binding protein isoform X2 n=1 Tax=Etheostoma spectabile TaxID=54343 RepID=UPI0013AEE734|nr:sarcoplasmic reticulum histidine-rich calcium-binding protein-like isoform X2 [Etheostoma spectabile]